VLFFIMVFVSHILIQPAHIEDLFLCIILRL